MKKLKSTIPNGGAPLGQFPVLRELFDTENKNAIEALLFSITEGQTKGVILKGCKTTNTGATYSISEGYVYLDGEVLYFPGATGLTGERFIRKQIPTEEGGTFADGSFKNYIDVNVAEIISATPAGVQYVNLDDGVEGQTLSGIITKGEREVFSNVDLDDFTSPSVRVVNTPLTNDPSSHAGYGILTVSGFNNGVSGVLIQQLQSATGGNISIRLKIGSNPFGAWVTNT